MSDVKRVEIVPGLVVEIDPEKWDLEQSMQLALYGDDHEVYLDLRVRTVETDEISRIETLLKVRTA